MTEPVFPYAACNPECAVCATPLRGRDSVRFEGSWTVQHKFHQRGTVGSVQLNCCVECVGNYFAGSLVALKHHVACGSSGESPES